MSIKIPYDASSHDYHRWSRRCKRLQPCDPRLVQEVESYVITANGNVCIRGMMKDGMRFRHYLNDIEKDRFFARLKRLEESQKEESR